MLNILLSEIMPAPASGPEWIELVNRGNEPVDLDGWYLMDELSQPSVMYRFEGQAGLESEVVIEPLSESVGSKNESKTAPETELEDDALWLDPGEFLVVEVQSKLNNSGDGVLLLNSSGSVQDSMSYQESQSDMSWSLVFDPSTQEEVWRQTSPSPGEENILSVPSPSLSPSPSSSPDSSASPTPSASPTLSPSEIPNLELTEIMACPVSGESEWIEVKNTSDFTASLSDWRVQDSSDNTRTISNTIPPGEYGVLSWSGSLLNNSGDSVALQTPESQEVFSASFSECDSGQSFVFQNGAWVLSHTPSPGQENPTLESDQNDQADESSTSTDSASLASSEGASSGTTTSLSLNISNKFPYQGKLPSLEYEEVSSSAHKKKKTTENQLIPDFSTPSPSKHGFRAITFGSSTLLSLGLFNWTKFEKKVKHELAKIDPFALE